MKKESVKSRLRKNKSSQSKDFYVKLGVIGIIVVLVLGVFLFAGLKGAQVSASTGILVRGQFKR